jgi:hypothetical protein
MTGRALVVRARWVGRVTMDKQLDMTDPDVRAMVLGDHEPEERWALGGWLISVNCRTCFQDWPCPSILAAREVEERMRDEPQDPRPAGREEDNP